MGLLVNIVDISTTKFRACSLLLYCHAPFSPWFHLVTVIVHLLYHVLPLSVAETLHWWWNASVMPWPNWCLLTLTQLWGVLWMFSHPVHACCSHPLLVPWYRPLCTYFHINYSAWCASTAPEMSIVWSRYLHIISVLQLYPSQQYFSMFGSGSRLCKISPAWIFHLSCKRE